MNCRSRSFSLLLGILFILCLELKAPPNVQYDWNLEIRNVSLEDDGLYECQILGSKSRSNAASLTVHVPPQNTFIDGGRVKEVIEDQNVTLSCISRGGRPAPNIHWYDPHGDPINNAKYRARPMSEPNEKLNEARSSIVITPKREMHNFTYICEAFNEAGDAAPTRVRIEVKYAPSVTIVPVKPGMPREGDTVRFQCLASANPPPFVRMYNWFLDDRAISSQFGSYYEIFNISRGYQGKQLKCSVQNDLGVATAVRTIEVQYGPSFVLQPQTTAGNELEHVQLSCAVDSNPLPEYHWTKGDSRDVVSTSQNLSLALSAAQSGVYFCHATVPGFPSVTSRPTEVLVNAPPVISSAETQTGRLGQDVQVDCAAKSVPEPQKMYWMFHGNVLDDVNNPHYRFVDTYIRNGRRSTLIIRESVSTDFGTYTCVVKNALGSTHLDVELETESPVPIIVILISAFSSIILFLVTIIFLMVCRKKLCGGKNKEEEERKHAGVVAAAATNNLIVANNMDRFSTSSPSQIKQEIDTPSCSNEADSAWGGSDDNGDAAYGRANNLGVTQALLKNNSSEPDFPPKPDVVSSGYVPYGTYVRDYNPPLQQPIYASTQLNVADPRFSATYGNPYLKQTSSANIQYSTFLPPPPPLSSPAPSSNGGTFPKLAHNGGSLTLSRTPMSSSVTRQMNGLSSSSHVIPNSSSLSNMACLAEEAGDDSVLALTPLVTSAISSQPPTTITTTGKYILSNGSSSSSAGACGSLRPADSNSALATHV